MVMSTALRDAPMAKKKGTSVQIDDDVVKTARLVSALTDKPMSTLISDLLRPVLAKMETEEMAKRSRSKGGAK
jgi:hypothetical protein